MQSSVPSLAGGGCGVPVHTGGCAVYPCPAVCVMRRNVAFPASLKPDHAGFIEIGGRLCCTCGAAGPSGIYWEGELTGTVAWAAGATPNWAAGATPPDLGACWGPFTGSHARGGGGGDSIEYNKVTSDPASLAD